MNAAWLLLALPLFSFVVIALFTRRMGTLSSLISTLTSIILAVVAVLLFVDRIPAPDAAIKWIDFGMLTISIKLLVDPLSKLMLLVVTGVGCLIHIYSLGYMKEDASKGRYFACLSLFMFSMIGIVLAENFLMMFIFWELVGVSSFLLIGHWFERPAAADASKKAFITNKIGDFGFLVGILLAWTYFDTLSFPGMQQTLPNSIGESGTFIAMCLLLFCGTIGKSAMFPLHVWLPDAMEGPTPVSALIHAATMVAAGVYMLCRIWFLLEISPTSLSIIAWIGGGTALMAALIATQQNDIKRILAYSTLSQLGYMVMSVGLSAPGPAMYHLTTHAFFKALLFLGAGSVIYALHHEQNIWKMGGLFGKMKITAITFLIGTLALIGCPGLSGFFSKDEIILAASHHSGHLHALYYIALGTAFLTAFYMVRLFTVAFINPAASRKHDSHGDDIHESPAVMTMPLILLAIPSILVWVAGIPAYLKLGHAPEHHGNMVMILSTLMFAGGSLVGYFLYIGKKADPISIPLFQHKFYFDEFYGVLIKYVQQNVAMVFHFFDRFVLDGLFVTGSGLATNFMGRVLSWFQTGNVQTYVVWLALGILAIFWFMIQ
ncbi:MAG: NADH-quinone oxidoreductase subunit L [Verrucomicrobiota bacterium]|nr:NADH-quinone oxidoreductase subunit L [Verrucomicrobiota bacterium]